MNAQTELVTWNSVRFKTEEYGRWSFALRPVVRHNQDLANYANTSLDLSFARSFKGGLKVQYLYRYWWVDDGPYRTFWWFDVSKKHVISPHLTFKHRLRWHIAFNSTRYDPNYLRYLPILEYKLSGSTSLFAGSELWYELEEVNAVRRHRHILGVSWNITDIMNLNFQYWYERSKSIEPFFLRHTLNTTVNFRI